MPSSPFGRNQISEGLPFTDHVIHPGRRSPLLYFPTTQLQNNATRVILWTLTSYILLKAAYLILSYDPPTEDDIASVCHERRLSKIASKLPGFNPKLDVLTWVWQPTNQTIASKFFLQQFKEPYRLLKGPQALKTSKF